MKYRARDLNVYAWIDLIDQNKWCMYDSKWTKQRIKSIVKWQLVKGKRQKKCRCHNELELKLILKIARCRTSMAGKFCPEATYAIFSDGERHGTSSSSSSSLSSHSSPSSLPDMLNEDDVNISGTGNIDGRLLPGNMTNNSISYQCSSWFDTHSKSNAKT